MTEPRDPDRLADAAQFTTLGNLMSEARRDLPSEQQVAQLAERLGPVLGSHGALPVASGASVMAKLGVLSGLAVLIVAGVLVARRPSPEAPAVLSSAASRLSTSSPTLATPVDSQPPNPALESAAVPSASAPAALSTSPSAAPNGKKSPPNVAANDGLSEPALLEQARRVLASSPAVALALTTQHAARFPNGVLRQEREVIAIEALRRLNRSAEADARAAAFAKAYPGSAHRRMVEVAPPK